MYVITKKPSPQWERFAVEVGSSKAHAGGHEPLDTVKINMALFKNF